MAQIDKPNLHFNTILYTGNGSNPRTLTGVGFQPDWTWLKNRTNANGHTLADAVRGANKTLSSDGTATEITDKDDGHLDAFTSDGFTVGAGSSSDNRVNDGSHTYVAWNWKANGAGSANTDGDINSTVSANTTSGVSILKYSGNGTSSQSIGHGLGTKPQVVIVKCRTGGAESWIWWQDTTGNGTADQRLLLSGTQANYGNNLATFQNTTFTTPSTNDTAWNGGSGTYVAYAFTEKKGFSKFGSYKGRGSQSANNKYPFTYCGFKPAFVLVKNTQQATDNWFIWDNKRPGYNQTQKYLSSNNNNVEADSSSYAIDFLSNGFTIRSTTGAINNNNEEIIFMAFAENPIVGSNDIPATAR